MKYCLIKDNQIVKGPEDLPKNTENVSNFYLLDDAILKTYGWLPYRLIDNKGINQKFVSSNIEIFENEVVETKTYRDLTQQEIDEKERLILEKKWNQVRQKRNNLLKNCDWTQLNDSPVDKVIWSNYRETLRNIPQDFSDPDSVVWPIPPND